MRKKRLFISIAIIGVFIFLAVIILSLIIPSVYLKKQKRLFEGYELSREIDQFDSIYYARYEMTMSEWATFQNELLHFRLISVSGGAAVDNCTWASFVDSIFTEEEIINITDVYYQNISLRGAFLQCTHLSPLLQPV